MSVFISKSPEDTINFGENYAKNLKNCAVVVLNGEMGAGKTVFCKGVAKGLGYMNDYSGKLYHFDCYRLKNGAQAEGLGLTDYFYAGGVCVVEWAENIKDVLPEQYKIVTIEKTGGEERKIIYD